MLMIDKPDTAAITHEVDKMLIVVTIGTKIKHQRISIKRIACVIYK